jgi:hypothetical protein
MSNIYYTVTGAPVAQGRGASSSIRSEFALISTGFDGVATGFAAKGNIAGQTWTGIHTFPATTYGVTAALGSSGAAFATLDFVNAVAFSSTLPAQASNVDKFTTTDGTNASWSANLKASVIRFKDGTDATKLLAFSLSVLTTGTTRTVTIPDKSGTMAMTSDVGIVLLATLTPTAAANVDFLTTFSASYDNYLILGDALVPNVSDQLCLRVAVAGAADSAANYCASTTLNTYAPVTSTVFATGKGGGFVCNINNVNGTNGKTITSRGSAQSAAGTNFTSQTSDYTYIGASSVTGIRLFWFSGNNFTATGTIKIYGYSN